VLRLAIGVGRGVVPNGLALIHTGLGEHAEAFEWLERAYQERNGWMAFLQVEPRFDPLREEPRFQDLLRRMNLRE
jgi:serine/threonine-protein kinase